MLARLGEVEIWRILETVEPFLMPDAFFDGIGPEDVAFIRRHAPHQLDPTTGEMLLPIQGVLIRTPRHVVLVDACLGNDKTCRFHPAWHRRSGPRFHAALAAAGAAPEDVDYVMCTHLHVDHVGWNTRLRDGRWVPTFANARYLFPEADHAHFGSTPNDVFRESVLPVIEAGQAELVGADHALGDEITLLPTPGHTPGHVSVRVRSGGAEALITGDAIHAAVQCRRPDWNFAHDHDKPRAAASRRRLLEYATETRALVLGSHFSLPSIGTVRAEGDAFAWTEAVAPPTG